METRKGFKRITTTCLAVFITVLAFPVNAYAAGPGLYYATEDASAFWYDAGAGQSVPLFNYATPQGTMDADSGIVTASNVQAGGGVQLFDVVSQNLCEVPAVAATHSATYSGTTYFTSIYGIVKVSQGCGTVSSPIQAGLYNYDIIRGVDTNGLAKFYLTDYDAGTLGMFDPTTDIYTSIDVGMGSVGNEITSLAFHSGTMEVYFTAVDGVYMTDVATWSTATYLHQVGAPVVSIERYGNLIVYNEYYGTVYVADVYTGAVTTIPAFAEDATIGRVAGAIRIIVHGYVVAAGPTDGIHILDLAGTPLPSSPIYIGHDVVDIAFAHEDSICGNGNIEHDETCDGANVEGLTCSQIDVSFLGGTLACAADCKSFDITGCLSELCNNSIREGSEACDGSDNPSTCTSLGYDAGTLGCTAQCTFDESACVDWSCGNGTAEGSEECDGVDNPATCISLGHDAGTLGCTAQCSFDESACVDWSCGDDTVEGNEECDGVNMNEETCETRGYETGTLACTSSCIIDDSGCANIQPEECGNGSREGIEECDGADLNGETCASLDLGGGTLDCTNHCVYETAGCENQPICGDNTRDPGEECDGTDLSVTCASLGFEAGTLSCTGECTVDVSSCIGSGNNNNNSGANNTGGCSQTGAANGLPILFIFGFLMLIIATMRRRRKQVVLK